MRRGDKERFTYINVGMVILIITISLFFLIAGCSLDSDSDSNSNSDPAPTYTVTYNNNGNDSGSVPVDSNTYEEGTIVTVMGNNGNLVKTGYTFVGWNTMDDGTGSNYVDGSTFEMGSYGLTLYAEYTMIGISSSNIGLLKVVPAGSFQRDFTVTNISTISNAFRISEKEITRAQFAAIMAVDPSNPSYSNGSNDPVQMTNWYHAIAFCNKLSIAESLTPLYSVTGVDFNTLEFGDIPTAGDNADWNAAAVNWDADGYRLPTEMEWMWAAMGATSGSGYADNVYLTGYGKLFAGSNSTLADGSGGSNVIGDYAWSYVNSSYKTHPVGTTGTTGHANELGLYDMSGNVYEWIWDWSGFNPSGTLNDYRGAASGPYRILRGGSWLDNVARCTVADWGNNNPSYRDYGLGFRVVRP